MIRTAKKFLFYTLSFIVSLLCFGLAYVCFSHGSSYGFELGIFFILVGVVQWSYWEYPDRSYMTRSGIVRDVDTESYIDDALESTSDISIEDDYDD